MPKPSAPTPKPALTIKAVRIRVPQLRIGDELAVRDERGKLRRNKHGALRYETVTSITSCPSSKTSIHVNHKYCYDAIGIVEILAEFPIEDGETVTHTQDMMTSAYEALATAFLNRPAMRRAMSDWS